MQILTTMNSDSYLCKLPAVSHPKILQALCIATGCDFPFLLDSEILKTFFSFAGFISLEKTLQGSLACDPEGDGFLACMHLVGVAYYTKDRGAFLESTPVAHYNL